MIKYKKFNPLSRRERRTNQTVCPWRVTKTNVKTKFKCKIKKRQQCENIKQTSVYIMCVGLFLI